MQFFSYNLLYLEYVNLKVKFICSRNALRIVDLVVIVHDDNGHQNQATCAFWWILSAARLLAL
jgi:hypothetical protein